METLRNILAMQNWSRQQKSRGKSIGFVPTMGALHRGHESLIQRANQECDQVVVSIFVNPMQFGPKEDLAIYPRDLQGDTQKSKDSGCDLLFVPDASEVYGPRFQTRISLPQLSQNLCGAKRSGHFEGVATGVAKLFLMVNPDLAFFGKKDFQQLQVIRQMVEDLNFPIRIIGCPTMRESDGLAMSSRNAYLSEDNRKRAGLFPKVLKEIASQDPRHTSSPQQVIEQVKMLLSEEKSIQIEYVELVDALNLMPVETFQEARSVVLGVAIRIPDDGGIRLIDHCIL